PNGSSQSPSVFSGLVALQATLPSGSLSLLRTGSFLFNQPFQPSTQGKVTSSARCSAANVGPNLSSLEPEYFFRIKFNPRRRSFSGLLRLEGRPALPCFNPSCPTSRYRRHSLFTWP